MKNLMFIFGIISGMIVVATAQTQEEQLWQKIQKESETADNNDDIIDYVIDYPNGIFIKEVENQLFKKCMKSNMDNAIKLINCQDYLALFEPLNGQYVESVHNILNRLIEEESAKSPIPKCGLPCIIEFFKQAPEIAETAKELYQTFSDQDGDKQTLKLPIKNPSSNKTEAKAYSVILTFVNAIDKVTIDGKPVNLTTINTGLRPRKQAKVSLTAGNYELKVYSGTKEICGKKIAVKQSTTMNNPCS